MATLTAAISSTVNYFTVTGDTSLARIGQQYRIDDEVITLREFVRTKAERRGPRDPNRWGVSRGDAGTTAASHLIDAPIVAVEDAVASSETLAEPLPFAAPSGGGGVTVDNQSDPPEAVTTIVAVGSVVGGGEATFVTFPPGWSFDANEGALVVDTNVTSFGTVAFRTGTDPDFYNVIELDSSGILVGNEAGQTVFRASPTGINSDFTTADGDINLRLKEEDGANDRLYGLVMGNARAALYYLDPAGSSVDNTITLNTTGIHIGITTGTVGFFGGGGSTRPAAIADATTEAEAVTQLNTLLAALRGLGLIAT